MAIDIKIASRIGPKGRVWVATVTDPDTQTSHESVLDSRVIRPLEVRPVAGKRRAVIIGDTNNGVIVIVADHQGNTTRPFLADTAAVSKDGRLIAYQHLMPRGELHPVTRYSIYDVTEGDVDGDTPGQQFYPQDNARHARQSDLV
ncbi:MAG: hypothetical protein A3H96_04210 [Acidobacteria bacterium RIFCSPLOWO2_02_FULL_67_36]|nr:MAG: hypothetical protein A3H96_04210 [Acidobacteria bacterium RIFCSPLOWO2_02_FULL_67_36]OFW19713.1 MAG: hypothetical protein A3G21_13095 [Acidobacteria bacterium RIFCSPLOWO2_12_FULL_66_21]